MKYLDYLDFGYKPKKGKNGDVICEFFVEPDHCDIQLAAGAVAAESSIGTWTEITTLSKAIQKHAARVFFIKDNKVKIAYPIELFEKGNMPQILSSIAGNIFGMKLVKNLRIERIEFPSGLIESFPGPFYGIERIRRILKVFNRPLLGTIIKPKLGLQEKEHARVAYNAWLGGCDIVKDDENLSSLAFNKFEKRITETLRARDKIEKETGERKIYMPNITAPLNEMLRRAKFVKAHGGEYVMVDIITCGWSALQELRNANNDLKLVLHAHRAGHAAFTRNRKHGISMLVIAKIARLIGIDQLHVGTDVGKMFETKKEIIEDCKILREKLNGIKPVMPVTSGGLHPRHIPALLEIFGKDFIIQMGGGIHGHPMGTVSGSMAARQALEAAIKRVPLQEYAKKYPELASALKYFK